MGFVFETAPKIIVEDAGAARLGEIARGLGVRHALMVTDPWLADSGLLAPALASCAAAGVQITLYRDVQADPPQAVVLACAAEAKAAGVDGVIGFGGGSSMDTAKLAALLVGGGEALTEVYGVDKAKGPRLPLIQVPTTAGTGSEATAVAIVTTPDDQKMGVVSPHLLPDVALLDATLTLGLPPAVTAMTGIDAMVHAIEAYTSRIKKNPISDSLALKALELLAGAIRAVIADGANLDARRDMLVGSLLAGMAFANSPVGAVHALAYPLGGLFHVPHGLSNALVLTPVLEFNLPAAGRLYAELDRVVSPDAPVVSEAEGARRFVAFMSALVADMPMAQRLEEVGVGRQDLERLARDAMNVQRLLINNPRDVTYDDALGIYGAVLVQA
ncbi:iron-containing alcohol dehydrogenase [Phenylobacterium aquaticum]|uniref:iron-containing alcohol dehydrogenase n=1 Tax=Phenylobacterium aquaticum TaxID=1763816 RepID=UPI0026F30529|nr:iron-containing alcohol dehydrogenase [Phenylobacterium aquaticum]